MEVILESGDKSGGGVDAQTSSAIVSGSNGGASTTAKSVDTEKGLKVGEKRKRTTFSAVQQVYLQNALDKGELNTKERRQLVADVLSCQTRQESHLTLQQSTIGGGTTRRRERQHRECVGVHMFGTNDEVCL